MGRLPFDPKRMAAEPPVDRPVASARSGDAAPLTVSQLAVLVSRALSDHLPATIRLIGEIGQFRERTHWYFDLKDAGAVMSCVMFASSARRAGFVPQVGQQVVLTGRVEFWDKGGRTQFMADRIEPVGAGALDLAFRKLCEELRGLGWFDETRKRSLPLLPRRVAVVTSRTGAALQDVLDTARRRCPAVEVALVDVRVQGEGAAPQIAAALRRLARAHRGLGIDVILVTRGGGSMEDLWAFNERIVAEAIVHSPIPVVAAIGHETDTTIAELVADVRGATPTQAAMRVFPDAADLRRQLGSLGSRLGSQVTRQLRLDRERLRGAARHPFLADPAALVAERRKSLASSLRSLAAALREHVRARQARLDRLAARLERHRPAAVYARREARLRHAELRLASVMRSHLCEADTEGLKLRLNAAMDSLVDRRQAALQSAARGLDLVGPHGVLRRGYSITLDADGRAIRSVRDAAPGATVTTRLSDGAFDSRVVGAGEAAALRELSPTGARAAAGVPATRRARRSSSRETKDQLGLFGDELG